MQSNKVLKVIEINGVKVEVELSPDEANNFPNKIESRIRIRDKRHEIYQKSLKRSLEVFF